MADLNSPAQEVLNAVYSSVVNIRVIVTINGQTGGGVGSGVVYTADGLILTNDHVVTLDEQVKTGQQITVTFSDGSTAPATIVGTDQQKDVAAIKVQKTGLVPVTFGATKDVHLAEWAIVIGSPLDFRNSVTLGIVSGLNRTLDTGSGTPPLTGLMQIDTPISPGNSGGGCFDTAGPLHRHARGVPAPGPDRRGEHRLLHSGRRRGGGREDADREVAAANVYQSLPQVERQLRCSQNRAFISRPSRGKAPPEVTTESTGGAVR